MEGRKRYKQISIDVEPFLSIMAIVLKLISVILVVIVMRIALNPKAIKLVNLLGRATYHGVPSGQAKEPSYVDCFEKQESCIPPTSPILGMNYCSRIQLLRSCRIEPRLIIVINT